MTNKFGKFLEELRGSTSLRVVAEKAELSHTYIRDLELGINRKTKRPVVPSMDTLEKLAKVYDYPINDMIDKSGYAELVTEVSVSYRKKHELEKGLNESFYWWTKLISDEDGFDFFVEDDIKELVKKYDIDDYSEIGGYASEHPIPLWDVVSEKNDISLKAKIVDEIIRICEKHNDFTKVLTEPDIEKSQYDLLNFLNKKGIRYGKVILQETDYKVIKGMLNAYFQERLPRAPKPENEDTSLPE